MYPVWVMLGSGVLGVVMKRTGFPAGPVVLGLLLGPLAEANLRRALLIEGPSALVTHPISAVLLVLALVSLGTPVVAHLRAARRRQVLSGTERDIAPSGRGH
jgi:putative tricarboxylic transport membrane protein